MSKYKEITIPAARQAGRCDGVFPIDLSDDAQIQAGASASGQNVYLTDTENNPIPYMLLPKDHICALNGIWTWYGQPQAIYDASADKTLTTFINSEGKRHVVEYNHATGAQIEVQVASTVFIDDHNNGSLTILPNGKYMIAYTNHNNDNIMRYRISTNVGDASAWDAEETLTTVGEGVLSYSQLWTLSSTGITYLFTREAVNKWVVFTSSDSGATWSASSDVLNLTGSFPYPRFWSNGVDKIRIVTTLTANNDPFFNKPIYAIQFDGAWKNMDGTALGTAPFAETDFNASSIVKPNSGTLVAWTGDITEHSDGTVHVLYYGYPDGDENNQDLYYAVYDDATDTWTSQKIMDEGQGLIPQGQFGQYYPSVAEFDPLDPTVIAVGVERNGIYEMELWKNTSGTWAREHSLTRNSQHHNFRPVFAQGRVAGKAPYLFWCGAGDYEFWLDYETAILQYPNKPAAGVAAYLDFDGATDKTIRVHYGGEDRQPLDTSRIANGTPWLQLLIGSMGLNESRSRFPNRAPGKNPMRLSASMRASSEDAFSSLRFQRIAPYREARVIVDENLYKAEHISVLVVVKLTEQGVLRQNLFSANLAPVTAAVITRYIEASNKVQFLAALTGEVYESITSDVDLPLDTVALVYAHYNADGDGEFSIRINEVEKTAVGSTGDIFASTDSGLHTIGQFSNITFTEDLLGNIAMAGMASQVLPKAYTDTLSRAFLSPATFRSFGGENVIPDAATASAAEIVAAIKADADLGTTGLIADAATAATQTTKENIRSAVNGRWTDEVGGTFDLTITDTP